MFNFIPIVGTVLDKVLGVVDKAIPDKDLAVKIKSEIQSEILTKELKQDGLLTVSLRQV